MTWKLKLFLLFAALLGSLYSYARATVPPTVFVVVSIEDSNGHSVEIPSYWSSPLHMGLGFEHDTDQLQLREGVAIACEPLHRLKGDRSKMPSWTLLAPGDVRRVSFAAKPGEEIAVAAIHRLRTTT